MFSSELEPPTSFLTHQLPSGRPHPMAVFFGLTDASPPAAMPCRKGKAKTELVGKCPLVTRPGAESKLNTPKTSKDLHL